MADYKSQLPPLNEKQQEFLGTFNRWDKSLNRESVQSLFNWVNAYVKEGGTEEEALQIAAEKTKGSSNKTWEAYQRYAAPVDMSDPVVTEEQVALFGSREAAVGQAKLFMSPVEREERVIVPPDAKKRISYMQAQVVAGDDPEAFEEEYSKTADQLTTVGDTAVRSGAISRNIDGEIAKLNESIDLGQADDDLLQSSVDRILKMRQDQDQYTLEKQFIQSIEDFADRNPQWTELRTVHRPIMERLAQRARKDAIIQSYVSKREIEHASSHWLMDFVDDTGEFLAEIFFDTMWSALRVHGTDARSLLYYGEQIRNLPEDQIPAALDKYFEAIQRKSSLVFIDEEESLDYLRASFGTTYDTDSLNENLTLEYLFAIPLIAHVGKLGVKGIASLGGNQRVVDDIVDVVDANADPRLLNTTEDAVQLSVPVSPNRQAVAGVADEVDRALLVREQIIKELQEMPELNRLSPEEVEAAVNRRRVQLEKVHGDYQIHTNQATFSVDKGVWEMEVRIGKKGGAPFTTEGAARNAMTKRNLTGEVVQAEDGAGFQILQRHPVTETMADKGFTNYKLIGNLKRFIQGPKAFVDTLLGNHGTTATFNEARVHGAMKKMYRESISKLNRQDFDDVNEMLNLSHLNEEWFNRQTLQAEFLNRTGREITPAAEIAYFTSKQMSDFAHFLDNRKIYKDKASKGLETVKMSFLRHGEFDANVFTAIEHLPRVPPKSRAWNAATNQVEAVDEGRIKELLEKGYILVRPDDPSWTFDEFGEGVSYIVTKQRKSVSVNPLTYNQLPYKAGGRREYAAPYFVGQRRTGVFEDGTKYENSPRFFRTANTPKQAEEWVQKANSANEILLRYRGGKIAGDEAEALIQHYTGKSLTEWSDMAESEGWDLATKFEFKANRGEFPVDYDKENIVRMFNPESFENQFGVRKPGRLSSRGDRLLNVMEEDAEVLDFFGSMTRNIDRATKAGVFADFQITAINRFNTSFSKYIDNADRLSPHEIATRGIVKESLKVDNPELYNAIKAHQFYINSILRNRSSWDNYISHQYKKFGDWVESFGGHTGKKVSEAIHKQSNNPIETLKSLNFDLTLGAFNPKQFLMQVNAAFVATTIDPVNGWRAAIDLVPLRYILAKDNAAFSQFLSRQVADATDGQDLVNAAEQFRRLGFHDFGSGIAMMDTQNTLGASSSRLVGKVSQVRESARVFFEEGERAGRLVAYGIARRKFQQKFPDADPFGRDADNWIRLETDRLTISPNADNNPMFTKGPLALPTQFWSYMVKLSDALLTGSGGRYSNTERAQMAAGQVLLYGAAGFPAMSMLVDQYEEMSGNTLSPEVAKSLHNGMIDGLAFFISGGELNTDFSSTSSLSGFWGQIFENLAENPISTVAGGATGSRLSGIWKAMEAQSRIYGLWTNPTPEAVTMTALAGLGSVASSLSVSSQAYLAYNTGIWHDRYGREVAHVTKAEAIAAVFGMPPQDLTSAYRIAEGDRAAKQKYINEVTPIVQALHSRYLRAETQEERDHIQNTLNALSVVTQQTGYWDDVVRQFTSYSRNQAFAEEMKQRVMENILLDKEGMKGSWLSPEQREEIRNNK